MGFGAIELWRWQLITRTRCRTRHSATSGCAQDFGGHDGVGDEEGLAIEGDQYGNLAYCCNIWAIPERDNTFDVGLCTEVLERIPYPNETIKELVRLVKPGGMLIVTAPFFRFPI